MVAPRSLVIGNSSLSRKTRWMRFIPVFLRIFAGIWMWGYMGEKGFYDELINLYRKHLDLCEKRDTMLENAVEKLRKYEPDSSIINFKNMDIEGKQ